MIEAAGDQQGGRLAAGHKIDRLGACELFGRPEDDLPGVAFQRQEILRPGNAQ